MEHNGTMHYRDPQGEDHILYPTTKLDNVIGADAALAGKAPAGYGLGGESPYSLDCNTIVLTGWYSIGTNTANRPSGFRYATLMNMLRAGGERMQFCMDYDGQIAVRIYDSVTWQPWEWVNPPMELGVEYRTIERYNDKPVYTKLINCGTATNGKTVAMGHGTVIRHSGNLNMNTSLPFNAISGGYWSADSFVQNSDLKFSCGAGFTDNAYTWYEQIWWI